MYDTQLGNIECKSLNAVHAPSSRIRRYYIHQLHINCINLRDKLTKRAASLEKMKDKSQLTQLPLEKLCTPTLQHFRRRIENTARAKLIENRTVKYRYKIETGMLGGGEKILNQS